MEKPKLKDIIRIFEIKRDIVQLLEIIKYMVGNQESDFYEWNFKLGNNHIDNGWWACFEIDHFKKSKRFYENAKTIEEAIFLVIYKAIESIK